MVNERQSFVVIFAISALSLIAAQYNNNKLQIDIHYESLCPDSRNFIQNQLKKSYASIKDKVSINYIPFGKSNSYSRNGKTKFSCQHGERECEGNKLQSCALDIIGPNQDKQTEFVICAMDFLKIPTSCARNAGLDLDEIQRCTDGERGTQLQLDAEKYSRAIIERSGFVPSVTYGQKYSAKSQWSSLEDFKEIVDEHLEAL